MKEIIQKFPRMLHGGDYNPDQWLDRPDILEADIRLMKEANVNCVSLGIFAWAKYEPEEGKYDFEWMKEIIDRLYRSGIYTVLATPSGAMPQWLMKEYEEVRMVDDYGVRNLPGARHNFCPTSPVIRKKVKKINHRLSEALGNHPGVIMWHISNEYGNNMNGGDCHCELCQQAFRKWLKNKYKSLDNLNKSYWNAFWSHTITDWNQIHSPVPNGEYNTMALTVDWRRFVSEQVLDFCKEEIRAVRKYSDLPVTANMMEFFKPFDYNAWAPYMDVISWDNYPEWHRDPEEVDVAVRIAMLHTLFRSLKKQPFLLMESTPSIVNWKAVNTQKRPGMHELGSLQAVAYGSDSVQYFQWRKSRGASEKFHGAVVGHDGTSNTRTFREVSALGYRLGQISDAVYDTCNVAKAAIILDWENWWTVDSIAGPRKEMRYIETVMDHFRAFAELGIEVDLIDETADLSDYKLVAAPMTYMYRDGYAEKVRAYVAQGGTYLSTAFCGVADSTDLCFLGDHPLKDVLGVAPEEVDTVYEHMKNHFTYGGKTWQVGQLREISNPVTGADAPEVISTYEEDYYAGAPVLTAHAYGEGKAYYLSCETEAGFLTALYRDLAQKLDLTAEFTDRLPYGVFVTKRSGAEDVWFLMNFNKAEAQVELPFAMTDLESGKELSGTITLKQYQCLIMKKA